MAIAELDYNPDVGPPTQEPSQQESE
jgi:hypothetical protein